MQNTLWAAAAMVAASAAPTSPASFLPPSESTAHLARPELPVVTLVAPSVAPPIPATPAADPNAVPLVAAAVQQAPDSIQWFVFGGTFAFLAVILVAIWLMAR
jgi:hypothetical protein